MDSFESASKRIRAIIEDENHKEVIRPSVFMSHGFATAKTILFYHGYTKSPIQFEELAFNLFKKGFNVWIPRLPYHGLKEEFSDEQQKLSTADLKSFVARNVDLIKGLGKKSVVMGISGGGVLAAWGASRYPGLHHSICLSPALGIRYFPQSFYKVVPDLMRWLPNRFVWWNGEENKDDSAEGYSKLSTKALGAFLELGVELFKLRKESLASAKLTMVINLNDDKVDNEIASKTLEGWKSQSINEIVRIDFSEDDNLSHDIVSDDVLGEKKERLYSLYEELIDQ